MSDAQSNLVEMAKLAEQAERYEDMSKYMMELVKLNSKLTAEQRNLLSVAFKNIVGSKRSAWRIISSIAEKCSDETKLKTATQYLAKIEEELIEVCKEILGIISDNLIPASANSKENEEKVFFYKMQGDYYRYITEVKMKGEEKQKWVDNAQGAYENAHEAAQELANTNPIRLGLALNMSVFLYEIVQDTQKACDHAKKAFDDAIAELDNLKEDSYKDSTLIMQLLRDNLTLWTSEEEQEPQE